MTARAHRRAIKSQLRPCGGCTECCTAMAVRLSSSSTKAAREPCPREGAAGCSRYATRPADCVDYHCAWRCRLWGLEDQHRPDLWGVLVDADGNGTACVRVLRDDAAQVMPEGLVPAMKRAGIVRIVVVGPDGAVMGELT